MKNKTKIGIEYICTGNGGRSPTAETIGKDYVKQCGLEDRIRVYSSGTAAEMVENDLFKIPIGFLLDYIEIGFKSETYHGKARDIAGELLDPTKAGAILVEDVESGVESRIRNNIEYCIRYLMADEVAKRDRVLLEVGLIPTGHFHQQTKVRDDVELILPMNLTNAALVKQIYSGSEYDPQIITICQYTGIDGDINDPFGGTIEDFRKTRDLIGCAVKKTIEKAAKEYLE